MTVRHASGEEYGCVACYTDALPEDDTPSQCLHPEPDPEDPGLCRWCSHAIEPVPVVALPMTGECE